MIRKKTTKNSFILEAAQLFFTALLVFVSMHFGYSQTTFTPYLISDSAYNTTAIFATDIDQDSDYDIFIQSYKETPTSGSNHKQFSLKWLQQNEDNFSIEGNIYNMYGGSFNGLDFNFEDIQFHDVNNNQKIDILATLYVKIVGEERYGLQCHFNKGFGTFDDKIIDKNNRTNSFGKPILANLESDSIQDILVYQSGNLLRYSYQGNEYFKLTDTLIHQYFEQIFAKDLNGDSKDDLAAYQNDSIFWFKNSGLGQFTTSAQFIHSETALDTILFIDLNIDGYIDLVTVHQNNLKYLRNNGDESFESPQTLISFTSINSVKQINFGDLDLDSKLDLILNTNEGIKWYKNNENNDFTEESKISTSQAHYIQTIDFDMDGDLDVLSADFDNTIQLYSNNISEQPTAINELNSKPELQASIFPNPMSSETILSFVEPLPFKIDLVIYNNQGKIIQSILNVQEQHVQIKNLNISKGIYLINALQHNSNQTIGSYQLIVN